MNDKHLSAHIGQYALLKNNENKVLLLERAKSRMWCLPGGRLSENEEWDVGLIRELKEELNLDCYGLEPFAVNLLSDDYQVKYCTYFTLSCSSVSPLKMSDEHTDWGWFGFEELKDIDIEDNKVKKVILDFLEQI